MSVSHEDAAHPLIALPVHPHLPRRLNEIEGFRRPQELSGNSPGPATRLRQERDADLAGQHVLIGNAHLLGRPWFEDRVLPVAERRRRPAGLIAAQRMVGMLLDRPAQTGGVVATARAL